jgi:hypothetical protein
MAEGMMKMIKQSQGLKEHKEERDYRIGKNRVYLGDDNTLNMILIGDIDYETGMAILDVGGRLMSMVEGKVNCLVDFNSAGKFSSAARRTGLEIIDNDKTGKVAIFGTHPVARVLASFVIGMSRKKDMRFFKTREEALAWLRK